MRMKISITRLEVLRNVIKDYLEDIFENSCYYNNNKNKLLKDKKIIDYLIDKEIKAQK